MDKVDLAEMRALLRASAEAESRKARKPLLGGVRGLLAPSPRPAAPAATAYPAPWRAGVRAEPASLDELALTDPLPPAAEAAARHKPAFGHRQAPASEPTAPLLLTARAEAAAPAPALDEADVGEALRRLGSVLARSAPAPAETPYLPEDLSDVDTAEAERLFARVGIEPPAVPAPAPEPEPEPALEAAPAPAPAPAPPPSPAAELLLHLERVFLAERAALESRRMAA
jgi:hypothetical protein